MIFRSKLARAIVRGKKTQTRRPARWAATDDAAGLPDRNRRVVQVPQDYAGAKALLPCRYRVGADYALQMGRGKPAEPGIRLQVTEVRGPERVDAVSLEDAIAEGFRTREEFFDYWHELYDKPNQPADLERLVWVISFQPIREDRYLALRPGEGEPMGRPDPQTGAATTDYVHGVAGAIRDEDSQAVPEDVQDQYVAEGWEKHARRRPGLEERLQVARTEARRKGVDVHRLEKSIERRILAYEKLVRAA